jgi:hypothetical protein
MVNHPSDASLQHFGCWAIANLAIGRTGALEAAAAAAAAAAATATTTSEVGGKGEFSSSSSSSSSSGLGLAAVRSRARETAAAVALKGRQGAVEVCKAALRRFPRHPGIAEKSRLALEKLQAFA